MRHLAKAIERDPNCGAAYLALGRLLLDQGEPRRAEALFARAVELVPEDASGQFALGVLLRSRGRHDAAVEPLGKATLLRPRHAESWRELGEAQLLCGDLEAAEVSFRRLAMIRPDEPAATVGLAAVAERRGDPEAAIALVEPTIRTGVPTVPMLAIWGRACARVGRAAEAAEVLAAVVEALQSAEQRQRLGHVLGECLDRAQRYDEAFEAHRRANEATDVFYDPEAHSRHVDRLLATFEEVTPLPPDSDAPTVVLVVGMPRSGTSLVETILSRHPEVRANGELALLGDLAQTLSRQMGGYAFPDGFDAAGEGLLRQLGERYRQALGDAAVVTDKLPDNYLLVGLAVRLLPNVKVVWCRRSPEDTCLSCYFQDFGPRLPYTRQLGWLGRRYQDHERIARHWQRVLPGVVHEVEYESLVANPASAIRDLLEHCGLPWDDRCLTPEATARTVATASYAQVQQPIYTRSVGRSEAYTHHLEPLREALRG